MEEFVDYYGILELQKDASIEDIEEAIKKTRKRFRRLEGSPDAEQRTNAEKMMQRLNEADELFHDEVRRGKYDASYDANKREVGREPHGESPMSRTSGRDWVADAKAYYEAGQYANAFHSACEAVRADASDGSAWLWRARASQLLDKYDDVIFSTSELLKLDSDDVYVRKLLAFAYYMTDEYEKAESQLLVAQKIDPSDYLILALLADVRYYRGQYDVALQMCRNLYEAHPDSEIVRNSLCRCLRHDAEDKMSSQGSKVCFANLKQVEYVEKVIAELDSMGKVNSETAKWVVQMRGMTEWARKRHFVNQEDIGKAIIGFIVLFFILAAVGAVYVLIYVAIVVVVVMFEVFPEGWRINKRNLGDAAWKTGLQ